MGKYFNKKGCYLRYQSNCNHSGQLLNCDCIEMKRKCSTCNKTCYHENCGVNQYKYCEHSQCGIKTYNTCWHLHH